MYTPVDAASIAVFRVLFGGILIWEVLRYFDHGWIERYYTGKRFYFTYPGFSWVHPWPSLEAMELHFVVLGVLAACVAAGLFYLVASVGLFFAFSYVFLLEQSQYLNHFYFVILVAATMMLAPANVLWSVDEKIRPAIASSTVPQWVLWALRAQFGITYFYGGVAKLNPDWLRGYPLSDWIKGGTQVPIIGPYVGEPWMGLFLSYVGMLLDLLFVPLLLYRPTRWLGFLLAVAFNLMNDQLFFIGIFPWVMIAGTLLFFEPDWPRRFRRFFVKGVTKRAVTQQKNDGSFIFTTRQKGLAAVLVAFFVYQFLFPLRHWLYPGVVHWTEEGHMYAWHMMLRTKSGRVRFMIKDPDSGREFAVAPGDYLDNRQERKMVSRPDMILQFAHWLRDRYREQGMTNVEVYADAWASLNGRDSQRLIDPDRDLAKVRWSILHSDWIMPLTEQLRP